MFQLSSSKAFAIGCRNHFENNSKQCLDGASAAILYQLAAWSTRIQSLLPLPCKDKGVRPPKSFNVPQQQTRNLKFLNCSFPAAGLVYSFTALLLCGCHVTSTFQKLPQELVAPKVCAAGTEGYREEEASSPHQNSWQPELQLFKGLLPLLTCHSGI